uniref:Putative Macrocin-O-methyltransferase n=1 Tax=Magnetococcus massalia (strain MO-1) TaxID=451514 RepID=A0A1S7LG93_MAGMO|nr:putative Macrocin-O-methyltransferase [Candidatus Magnetococcus massalia]
MKLKEFMLRASNIPFQLSRGRSLFLACWRRMAQDEFSHFYQKIHGYTYCCNTRLRALYDALHTIEAQKVKGDVVECGTARGGSAALMGLTLTSLGSERSLWLYDSFEGIPAPTQNDPDLEIAQHYAGDFQGELDQVQALFSQLKIEGRTEFVKGLFDETLPAAQVEQIALLHIDGDWYDSIMITLESLYDRVSIGGVIQLDDYGYWEGARKAVHDFMDRYGLDDPLVVVDYEGRQWIKSQERKVE